MKRLVLLLFTTALLVGCQSKHNEETKKEVETKVTVKNEAQSTIEGQQLTFDQHEYTYDVVTGATQTTFGSNPPALYTKEEKSEKMFWSNQPPLGLLEGYYYKNEGLFTGNNYGIVEIVTDPEDATILDVEFTEFASDSYYEPKYAGANKRLSDYTFFQADNTRTDETLVTVVNGITFVEQQMRNENRVTGDFLTVKGSSTSAREGFIPLAAAMNDWIREPYESKYFGYAKELDNGLIARLQIVTKNNKIETARYDEYFADQKEKMPDKELQPFYRQSKYYSLDYNEQTNNEFKDFSDLLTDEIIKNSSLEINNTTLSKHPSYSTYQELSQYINLTKVW